MTNRSAGAGRDGRLQELVEHWRERGLRICPAVKPLHEGWTQQQIVERPLGAALLQCADELAAILAVPAPLASDTGQGETRAEFERDRFGQTGADLSASAPLASSSETQGEKKTTKI